MLARRITSYSKKALLAGGLIGVFIATRWTFAAGVGGCQAEGRSAASNVLSCANMALAGYDPEVDSFFLSFALSLRGLGAAA